MTAEPADRLTIRAALLLGFGLTVGLWLWAGYDVLQRTTQVQREAAAINLRYMKAQELLATVRPQVLIVSVLARTALLDSNPENRDNYRRRVETTLGSISRALRRYVPVQNSDIERERVARLGVEIDGFGRTVLEVLGSEHLATTTEASKLLSRIVPRRELVIGVTDEVQALNRAAFVQEQTTIAAAHREMQKRVWRRLGGSLLASLGIALFASLYAGRLERRLRCQREKEIQNTRDLQRLSARLVDVQEEERRTIARELHDELGQVLEAVKVEIAIVQRKLSEQGSGALLNDAQAITQGALTTVRDLSHFLHPAVLDDLGLVAAVDGYLHTFGRRHAIRVGFDHACTVARFAPEIEIAAYRIVQEALTNTVRHASATACTVSVRHDDTALSVVIADDGCGFDMQAVQRAGAAAGLGLIGIRERVTQLHGRLEVESTPGRGTTVTIWLPTRDRSDQADSGIGGAPVVTPWDAEAVRG